MPGIDELAYKLYKEDWKNTHTTDEMRMDLMRDWYENSEGESYSEYLEEHGYGGEFYACYEEFMDNEFKDAEYMDTLLKRGTLKGQYAEYMDSYER